MMAKLIINTPIDGYKLFLYNFDRVQLLIGNRLSAKRLKEVKLAIDRQLDHEISIAEGRGNGE